MKALMYILGLVALIGLIGFLVSRQSVSQYGLKMISIEAPKGSVRVEVADTEPLQERGLSGRTSMPAKAGMIFVFETPGIYAFWMKDMLFPLDMVWIDADKRVVGIASNVRADSYPETYSAPGQHLYVLELNAGEAALLGIATGTQLFFPL